MSADTLIPGNKYIIYNPDRPATMFMEGNDKGLEGLTFIAREDDGRLGFDNGFGATFTIDPYGDKKSAKAFYAPGGEGLPDEARPGPRDRYTHVCIVPRVKNFSLYRDRTRYPQGAVYEKGDHIGHVNDSGVVLRYGEKAEAPRTQEAAGTKREEDYPRSGGAMGGAGGGGGGAPMGGAGGGGAAAGGAGGGGSFRINTSGMPSADRGMTLVPKKLRRTTKQSKKESRKNRTYRRKTNRKSSRRH